MRINNVIIVTGGGTERKDAGAEKGPRDRVARHVRFAKGKGMGRGNALVKAVEHMSHLFLGEIKGETRAREAVRTVERARAFLDGDRDRVAREFRESMMEVGQICGVVPQAHLLTQVGVVLQVHGRDNQEVQRSSRHLRRG